MRRLFIFIVLGLVLNACNSTSDSSDNLQSEGPDNIEMAKSAPWTFTLIERGCNSGYSQFGGVPINEVTLFKITSQEDLNAFWALHKSAYNPQPPTPQVDFNNRMILALLCPVYATGGYNISVDEIYELEDQLIIAATVATPGQGCVLTMTTTQPFIIVEVNSSPLPVKLNHTTIKADCD